MYIFYFLIQHLTPILKIHYILFIELN